MNLRERKFVNYIQTTVRIKHSNRPSTADRKRANSERPVNRPVTATPNALRIPANSRAQDSGNPKKKIVSSSRQLRASTPKPVTSTAYSKRTRSTGRNAVALEVKPASRPTRSTSCAPIKKDVNSQRSSLRSRTPVTRSRSVQQKSSNKADRQDPHPSIIPQTSVRTRSSTVQVKSLSKEAKSRSSSQRSSVPTKYEIAEQSGSTNIKKQPAKVTRKRAQTVTTTTKTRRNSVPRSKFKKRQDRNCGKETNNFEDINELSNDELDSDSDDSSDDDNRCTGSKNKSKRQNEVDEFMNQQYFERRYRQLLPVPRSDPPSEFHEMQKIWSNLILCLTPEGLRDYKKGLIRLLTGRVSSLQPLQEIFPNFPNELRSSHHRLYSLLCQCSGAYPFKNHEGSRLISQQKLADTSQIGAQIIVESLFNKVVPFDISRESNVLTQIETYVRIGIKDMLEEAVKQLPTDRNTITAADIKESLSSRLLS
ncbi:hypothetical protein CAEBREN_00126 [Caenorhabditis brenneri]|uniref:Uncharacterized protein n=1 Tax=Caenorhabditis brenneri TaxID=135651 RepID=G0NZ81_CAEBE|nr:hypothetical protein CAEBREN_00126 [Caenorhabditis brenneri]